jgi:protein transport protein SEC61 subunit beta
MSGSSSQKGVLARKQTPQRKTGGFSSLFKIYTDDTPGVKVGPTTVLVVSLIYMATVVVLHIFAKLRAVTAAPASAEL